MTNAPRAIAAALVAPAWLRSDRWRELMKSQPRATQRAAEPRGLMIADGAVRALSRVPFGPWRATCLHRSVAICLLLRWSGVDALLRLGARRSDAATQAHAWVEDANGTLLYGQRADWAPLS